jgi:high-affinity iron transporter
VFATALIVFRESLEAALFIGIVAAATRDIAGRWRWLATGVGLGVLGAALLARMAQALATAFDGAGQDLVTIGVLALALVMLLWHCTWVAVHAREMAGEARQLGSAVQSGQRRPWTLLVAVGLAVLREGAETVLFVAGSLDSAGATPRSVLLPGMGGLAAGVAVGLVLYAGLARIPTRQLFAVTNALIALLAASMASQLVVALSQAGFIDAWTSPVWDSSALLPRDSALGTLLHALAGYDAHPSGAQLAAYVGVLLMIAIGSRWLRARAVSAPRLTAHARA